MAPRIAFALAAAAAVSGVRATTLTLNDYVKFADGSAKYNPPTCAMPYDSLDLTRITAWSDITSDQDAQCGSCAKVCGSAGCDYLLVVDMCTWGADHLDISTAAGNKIVGSDTGNHVVSMELVDVKNCAGIWDGRMFNSWDVPNANLKALQAASGSSGSYGSATTSAQASSSAAAYAVFAPGASSAASPAPAAYSTPAVVSAPAAYSSPAPVYSPPAYSSPAPVPVSSAPVPSAPVYSAPVYSAPAPSSAPSSTPVAVPSSSSLAAYPVSSSFSVEATPTPYSSSSSSNTPTPTPSSSKISPVFPSTVTAPSTPSASGFTSIYGTGASSSIMLPVPTANGTIVSPSASATPSQAFVGASTKTTTTLSGLAMAFLFAAMFVLA